MKKYLLLVSVILYCLAGSVPTYAVREARPVAAENQAHLQSKTIENFRFISKKKRKSKMQRSALLSLIFLIFSLIFLFPLGIGFLFAVPTFIFGLIALKRIKESQGFFTGKGLAIFCVVISGLMLLYLLTAFLITFVLFGGF